MRLTKKREGVKDVYRGFHNKHERGRRRGKRSKESNKKYQEEGEKTYKPKVGNTEGKSEG